MRAKDIKRPFTWDQRNILIKDKIWYVPALMDDYRSFEFPGWESEELFGNNQPLKIEYCSGTGQWIHERALEEPETNWVAVEIKFDRVRKIRSKVINSHLDNLAIICGEGLLTTKNYFPSEKISEIYINFPDPWPKRRHQKNRIISDEFVEQMHRILLTGGIVTFVTDDDGFSEWTIDTFSRNPGFKSLYEKPYYMCGVDGYGESFFKDLWVKQGKTIKYHKFQKLES